MKSVSPTTKFLIAFAIAGALATGPAMADKGGKGHKEEKERKDDRGDRQEESRDERRIDDQDSHRNKHDNQDEGHGRFEDHHRTLVRDYYGEQFRNGRCPPGLKKKHDGCMPPGQAKKWQMGRPLPREVVYYPVPQPLVIQIGQPPSGYRYVRVASDILLIAVGSGMVVDAIQDLGR